MGNGLGTISRCLTPPEDFSAEGNHRRGPRKHYQDTYPDASSSYYYDEGLGHSFCYVRPDPSRLSSSKVHHHHEQQEEANCGSTMFRSISGASVSANTSTTPLSSANNPASMLLMADFSSAPAAAFDCTDSFSSVPLQPVPRGAPSSGPMSGPIDRGFLSGPIERGFMSGPIDSRAAAAAGIFSGPIDSRATASHSSAAAFQRSFSHGAGYNYGGVPSFFRSRSRKPSAIMRGLKRAIARTIISRAHNSIVAPIKGASAAGLFSGGRGSRDFAGGCNATASTCSLGDGGGGEENVQWAQGKAGEDRVHVVVSEEYGWVFVGIYDGFNGPDAPDYLLTNLYSAVHGELKGLLWEDKFGSNSCSPSTSSSNTSTPSPSTTEPTSHSHRNKNSTRKRRRRGMTEAENRRRWRCEWDLEELPPHNQGAVQDSKESPHHRRDNNKNSGTSVNHAAVLKALSRALQNTEDTYLGIADNVVADNPELALMGSCVLVMLMKGEDVYVMNVGDSRAVLARTDDDPDMIGEDAAYDDVAGSLEAVQLTRDHSTSVQEEVQRIIREHPDDDASVCNDRVKGSLKVTRAFGAGFLKQPKWNDALLEMFRIDYVGSSPYISCTPSLRHHRLSSRDRFLILSSDGLYQYFTNEEAVEEVESFIASFPDGDPAQHLVEEVLFRAAKRAGMDFHELLEIPQGDRRRYHDDVSIIVISLKGRIWRSSI